MCNTALCCKNQLTYKASLGSCKCQSKPIVQKSQGRTFNLAFSKSYCDTVITKSSISTTFDITAATELNSSTTSVKNCTPSIKNITLLLRIFGAGATLVILDQFITF